MALSRLTNFVAGTKILSAQVNNEFNNYLAFINNLIHKDGSVAMTGDFELNYANPSVVWDGTGGSAVKWQITETSGVLQFQYDSSGWVSFMSLNSTSGNLSLGSAGDIECGNTVITDSTPYLEWQGATDNWKLEEDISEDLVLEHDAGVGYGEVARFDAATDSLELQNDLVIGNDCTVGNDLTVSGTLNATLSNDSVSYSHLKYRLVASGTLSGLLASGTSNIDVTYITGDMPGIEPLVIISNIGAAPGTVAVTKSWRRPSTATQARITLTYAGWPSSISYEVLVLCV